MNQGVDESTRPGECPLCRAAVALPQEPRSTTEVLQVLAQHFASACSAIALPSGRAA